MMNDRLYPFVEPVQEDLNRYAAKLCTRDGRVVRSYFGPLRLCEAKAGQWFKTYYDGANQ